MSPENTMTCRVRIFPNNFCIEALRRSETQKFEEDTALKTICKIFVA